jgi:hypothetical protein
MTVTALRKYASGKRSITKYVATSAFGLVLFSSSAFATIYNGFRESEDQFSFQYERNNFADFTNDGDHLRWGEIHGFPGSQTSAKVTIHGDTAPGTCPDVIGCAGLANTCFLHNPSAWSGANQTALTGLTAVGALSVWAPKCTEAGYLNNRGRSLVATNTSPPSSDGNGGIGLYDYTGPNVSPPGTFAFMQPDAQKHTESVYLNFPANGVPAVDRMKPFSGVTGTLHISTKQAFKVGEADGDQHTAATQHLGMVLYNIANVNPTTDMPGSIEITPKVFCKGLNCGLTNEVHVQPADPAQGGHPFIGGTFNGGNQFNHLSRGGHQTPVWKSIGPSTQNVATDTVTFFQFEITWTNFKNVLRDITCLREGRPNSCNDGGTPTDNQVAAVFGPDWDVSTNWTLKDVRVGQEVHNGDWQSGTVARMGGRVQLINLDAE